MILMDSRKVIVSHRLEVDMTVLKWLWTDRRIRVWKIRCESGFAAYEIMA